MANSTPEELLARAIKKAREAGLNVTAASSRLDDDGITIEKTY